MEDDAISNFCAITGATPDQAKFFLESADNDMEQAMSAFYDQEGDDDLPAEEAVPSEGGRGAAPPVQQEQAGGVRQGQGAWPGEQHDAAGSCFLVFAFQALYTDQ